MQYCSALYWSWKTKQVLLAKWKQVVTLSWAEPLLDIGDLLNPEAEAVSFFFFFFSLMGNGQHFQIGRMKTDTEASFSVDRQYELYSRPALERV